MPEEKLVTARKDHECMLCHEQFDTLTPGQKRVFDAIGELERELGYAPSIREIGRKAGLASTSTVHGHLKRLVEAGLIKRATAKQGYVQVRS